MQIVIEIPDVMYKQLKWQEKNIREQEYVYLEAILDGKPLPKGHGDLIDRDDLLADSCPIDDWSGNEVNIVDVMSVELADAIIEADRRENE